MPAIAIVIVLSTLFFVKYLDGVRHPVLKTILNWCPAILFAYIIPAIITHAFNIDLSRDPIHVWSKDIIMPAAILTVMSALSFRQLKHIGWRPVAVFLSGSMTIALIPVLLTIVFKYFSSSMYDTFITEGYWKGLITMVGSWIGGSTSQLVLKELSYCSEELFITVLVMDNVLVNIWTIFMFQMIKKSDQLNATFSISDQVVDFVPDDVRVKIESGITLLLALAVLVFSYYMIDNFIYTIIFLSIAGLGLGNFIKSWNHTLMLRSGGILIIVIMAILGLKLKFENFGLPFSMLILSILWLISHYITMIMVGWKLKLHMAWIPIGSMANVGGISTAPAVTSAYNEEWMPHAIILAILSMVTGTGWGMLSIYLINQLIS